MNASAIALWDRAMVGGFAACIDEAQAMLDGDETGIAREILSRATYVGAEEELARWPLDVGAAERI